MPIEGVYVYCICKPALDFVDIDDRFVALL